jgi:hypothetical protein
MNRDQMVEMLMREPTMTRSLATGMVEDWARNGWRHRNGKTVTSESIRQIAKPSRNWLKRQGNAGRAPGRADVRAAKGKHFLGIF